MPNKVYDFTYRGSFGTVAGTPCFYPPMRKRMEDVGIACWAIPGGPNGYWEIRPLDEVPTEPMGNFKTKPIWIGDYQDMTIFVAGWEACKKCVRN